MSSVGASRASNPTLDIDEKSSQGFVTFYRGLPKVEKRIRFFDRKDYHTVHGEDALYIARNFYKTTSVVKYLGKGDNPLPSVTLNRSLFETVLRDLLVDNADHTIEIYEGSGSSWRPGTVASPGNLAGLEEILYRSTDMAETPVVMAATVAEKEGQRTVGVAYANAGKREIFACEFVDDDQLCGLEAIIVQTGTRECVIPEVGVKTTADQKLLMDAMERCGVLVSQRKKKTFDACDLEVSLARLVRSGNAEQHRDVLERPLAAQSVAGVIQFAELTADSDSFGKWSLDLHKSGKFMRLDAAAMRALHVMPSRGDSSTSFSLYGLLCKARTAMGKRLLRSWLKQPLLDVDDIRSRHDVVGAMVSDSVLRETMRSRIKGLPDIERLARKLDRGNASLSDLCQLYRASGSLPILSRALSEHEGTPECQALLMQRYGTPLISAQSAEHLGKFEGLIEAAVDLDRIPDEFLITASYNQGLGEIYEQRSGIEQELEGEASKVASDLGMQIGKQIKLERSNHLGHFLRITKKEETAVRKKMQGKYITVECKKDGVKFVSNKLRRLSEAYTSLSGDYAKKQTELVRKVISVAQGYVELWEAVSKLVAELDVLVGFAEVALGAPATYCRPEMTPSGEGDIVLEGSRHACVEAQEGVSFISNDCRLVRDRSWFQIITGPNMGGKSTYIRQVGACVLMAQVGAYVPCASAKIAIRDAIFARVGAGDCQVRGISTFMAEMLETAVILRAATPNSLIIIDELGRGTSTYDGFGLAWAISEHICTKVGAPCLFATHFHELTALGSSPGCGAVANYHVETVIDEASKRLTMLYRVLEGACDQSFGIHVAEFANFPKEVVEMAREKAAELEDFSPADVCALAREEERDASAAAVGGGGVKRKRVEPPQEAALERAKQFVRDFGDIDLMKPEAYDKYTALVSQLKEEAEQYPWLMKLISSST